MPHSYVSKLIHYIFSTKERIPFIDQELESRLWPYMGGIARENKMRALAIGGTTDHVHALLSLPATLSVAKAIQLIKGGSSKWIHDQLPEYYIDGQKEHHRKKTFEEEFLEFLDKYGVEYDRRYVFR